ncbi:sugar ABC transporter substrate-binding protein [Streptomyces ipomoeae]|uniref:ABC-type sugar transport system family protein n=2 Tax=Streptomyces ipomoeae TaxID=103232 RepID=L1KUY5_9ACTN|nr:substrate-binding domain-containing protein [Streptomyces ipomoeae]EKX64447.1 ABC-type sugar transport system family protein [Streptomyces ipomoeae 91-03]MDX2694573.1 substrate-binding domain-containing protein [Streptomyces ipomoeae]MDX2825293.1 substrate-binding domain-containing protein [Streptomyces ipomoeae]MDX2841083.1 substrate-binding domain-containing protein [Streptomyces ipomoeae]MDX2935997.1 substrate-binding domain-containing protein [Streptomyces ipomoeae]
MNPPPASHAFSTALRATALAAAICLTVAGCSVLGGSDSASDSGARGRAGGGMKVALISHGAEGDAFWDRVRKGAEAAAAKDGIELTYASDPDAAGQAELVREAIADKVDGIAVTLAKPQAMQGAVAEARAAGIPVVGLNSGIDAWEAQGLLGFFGQNESIAGQTLGDQLDARNAEHTLCVIHERGNVALEARCAGVRKTFGGRTESLYVDGTDMDAVTSTIAAKLNQDPSIDEVVTLGAQIALAAVDSVDESGSKAKIATFDLNNDLVKAVQNGDVQFAVDQQPYLQGYLAVDELWLYKTNGNISGGGVEPVLTGPALVTKKNIAGIAKFAANGTR